MKNLLSENMLRFGTKNLTESAKRKLVFESIMQTIKEHGLQSAVKRGLNEQAVSYEGGGPTPDVPYATAEEFETEVENFDENEEDPGILEKLFNKIEAALSKNIINPRIFRRFKRKLARGWEKLIGSRRGFPNYKLKFKRTTDCFHAERYGK